MRRPTLRIAATLPQQRTAAPRLTPTAADMPIQPPPPEPTREPPRADATRPPAPPPNDPDATRLLREMLRQATAQPVPMHPLYAPPSLAHCTGASAAGAAPEWQTALAALARHEVRVANELDRPPVGGNTTRLLVDGAEAYAAMFEAINGARDHVNIESYIVEAEGPGEELANLLCRKCAQGVRVNMIYDSWGSWQTKAAYFERLRDAGVALCEFNPILPWRNWFNPLAWSFNLRDHRKLLIVDGRVGFTGGVNISSVYSSGSAAAPGAKQEARRKARSQDPNEAHWRDTHVRIEGPVVAQLQQLFLDQWRVQTGRSVQPAHYYPALAATGTERIAVAARGAGERRGRFYRALMAAIEDARSRIWITVGYFVPTRRLLRALIAAAERGVDVRLVLPGFSDVPAAVHAARSQYGRLLAAGARIYEHCDALLHAKTTVIDGAWASIGSHNMDWRSFVHNAECNIIVLNTAFARHLERLFDTDIVACKEITLADWRRRGRLLRVKEWMARQVEYLL